ncbi:unnamed protein product [Paramecium octaurelia]|uniref:Uncharacterized protein n=1 Tax=Paramecium octaurelia TaxID=43137 RepID=A0A8S1XEV0_PAROT|nr:unnamed protein product [Paramecium octaurelia]
MQLVINQKYQIWLLSDFNKFSSLKETRRIYKQDYLFQICLFNYQKQLYVFMKLCIVLMLNILSNSTSNTHIYNKRVILDKRKLNYSIIARGQVK